MRRKAGLHKRVSSIFEDLHVSGRNDDSPPRPPKPEIPTEQPSPTKEVKKTEQPPTSPQQPSPVKEAVKPVEPPKEHQTQTRHKKTETQTPKPPMQKEVVMPKSSAHRRINESSKQKKYKINYRIVAISIVAICIISVGVAVSTFGMDIFRGVLVKENQPQDSMMASGENLTKIDWALPEELPHDMRDIMSITRSAAVVYEEEKSEIVVRGILFSKDDPSAIIGLDIVHVGDEIMGAKIAKITRKAVEFEKDGEIWEQAVER